MSEIATTRLSGILTREVELHELPSGVEVARLRIASTTRRRKGKERVAEAPPSRTGDGPNHTNHFNVEVYGAQARACAANLGKGSRVVVYAEVDWREWSDEQNNRREAVIFRARQVLVDWARPSR